MQWSLVGLRWPTAGADVTRGVPSFSLVWGRNGFAGNFLFDHRHLLGAGRQFASGRQIDSSPNSISAQFRFGRDAWRGLATFIASCVLRVERTNRVDLIGHPDRFVVHVLHGPDVPFSSA